MVLCASLPTIFRGKVVHLLFRDFYSPMDTSLPMLFHCCIPLDHGQCVLEIALSSGSLTKVLVLVGLRSSSAVHSL